MPGDRAPQQALSVPWQVPTCVPRAAVADDLLRVAVLVAGGSKVAGGAGPFRTGAGPAVLPGAKCWVPKVSGCTPASRRSAGARSAGSTLPQSGHVPHLPLAPFPICVVTAAQAAACPRVTALSVPVALAGSAHREAPVARLAAVTTWAVGAFTAGALPGGAIADGAH